MLVIDGGVGEGGGQILRTSLSLSVAAGVPFRIENIRAARRRPGLLRQHLASVRAAAAISGAAVEGAELGSRRLQFEPGPLRGGDFRFAVGTAGSACLVLQTAMVPYLRGRHHAAIEVEGGTHNPAAPPFDFLNLAYLPLLRRMGARMRLHLGRYGFYPSGGGRAGVRIEPGEPLRPISLLERGRLERISAHALIAHLPHHIAERELRVVTRELDLAPGDASVRLIEDATGPGNVLLVEVACERVVELFAGFGRRGVPAEEVARETVEQVRSYLDSGAAVGPYLGDQLMLPLALAGGGEYRTSAVTRHARTNAWVIEKFLDVRIDIEEAAGLIRIFDKARAKQESCRTDPAFSR